MSYELWMEKDRDWSEYPIGTKAKANGGGYWIKNERGWQWCTGDTFPSPGGDASGEVWIPGSFVSSRKPGTI